MKNFSLWIVLVASALSSCEEIISVTDISEDTVTILAPLENAEIETTAVQFSWEPIAFAEYYQLQVATPNFMEANAIVLDTIIQDSLDDTRSFDINLDPQEYEWRIRAGNSEYETAYKSANFEVVGESQFTEEMVQITSPEDQFSSPDTMITLEWEPIALAELYRIIVEDFDNQEVILEITTQEVSASIDFMASGNYEYSIRAETMTESTLFTSQTITIL